MKGRFVFSSDSLSEYATVVISLGRLSCHPLSTAAFDRRIRVLSSSSSGRKVVGRNVVLVAPTEVIFLLYEILRSVRIRSTKTTGY